VFVTARIKMPGVINTPDTANAEIKRLMLNAYHTLRAIAARSATDR
jgi:hypothetical protein